VTSDYSSIGLAFIWADLPVIGSIRWTTILTAVLVVLAVSWKTRRLLPGPVVAITWAASYEILYGWTNVFLHGWNASQNSWQTAALVGWLFYAYVSKVRLDRRALIVFAALWAAWILVGFNSNHPLVPATFDLASEILNVATKTWLAFCLTMGTIASMKSQSHEG
jgi:hypothetical protein